MPFNPLQADPPQVKALAAATVYLNDRTPFLVGQPVYVDSVAGTTLYGANHPGDLSATKYAKFKQTISNNKAFVLASAVATPVTGAGGAVTAAAQLRVVAMVDQAPKFRLRGDAAATTGTFIVSAGGGTAAGQADLSTKAATAYAVGVTSVAILEASGTGTILVGDKINFAGDTTDYFATATTATLDGTGVAIAITPPLQVAIASAGVAVTVTAAAGKTVLFYDAPAVGADVEVLVLESTDIVTVGNTAGALTAGQVYQGICTDLMHTAGAVNLTKAMR